MVLQLLERRRYGLRKDGRKCLKVLLPGCVEKYTPDNAIRQCGYNIYIWKSDLVYRY